MTDFCKCGNEPSGSIKCGEVLHCISKDTGLITTPQLSQNKTTLPTWNDLGTVSMNTKK